MIFEIQGVEKLIASKMMLPGSNRRIHSVHRHSGMVNGNLFLLLYLKGVLCCDMTDYAI